MHHRLNLDTLADAPHEGTLTETEFSARYGAGYEVFTEEALCRHQDDAMRKGMAAGIGLGQIQADVLKAREGLVARKVVDSNGRLTTRWVRATTKEPGPAAPAKKELSSKELSSMRRTLDEFSEAAALKLERAFQQRHPAKYDQAVAMIDQLIKDRPDEAEVLRGVKQKARAHWNNIKPTDDVQKGQLDDALRYGGSDTLTFSKTGAEIATQINGLLPGLEVAAGVLRAQIAAQLPTLGVAPGKAVGSERSYYSLPTDDQALCLYAYNETRWQDDGLGERQAVANPPVSAEEAAARRAYNDLVDRYCDKRTEITRVAAIARNLEPARTYALTAVQVLALGF